MDLLASGGLHLLHLLPHCLLLLHLLDILVLLALNDQASRRTRMPGLEARGLPDLALSRFGGGRDVGLRHTHSGQLAGRFLVHLVGEGLLRVSIVLRGEVGGCRALVVMIDGVVRVSTAADSTSA